MIPTSGSVLGRVVVVVDTVVVVVVVVLVVVLVVVVVVVVLVVVVVDVVVEVVVVEVTVVLFRRIDIELLLAFATTRSCFPSPLKSPTVTETGVTPVAKFVAGPKEPVPSPKRMVIEPLLGEPVPLCATARSSFPSPLKSPTVTKTGITCTAK